tara:strand:+ start:1245 stop:1760 length:516 start_codon:yes stop_codon:yes gene_type:complete
MTCPKIISSQDVATLVDENLDFLEGAIGHHLQDKEDEPVGFRVAPLVEEVGVYFPQLGFGIVYMLDEHPDEQWCAFWPGPELVLEGKTLHGSGHHSFQAALGSLIEAWLMERKHPETGWPRVREVWATKEAVVDAAVAFAHGRANPNSPIELCVAHYEAALLAVAKTGGEA